MKRMCVFEIEGEKIEVEVGTKKYWELYDSGYDAYLKDVWEYCWMCGAKLVDGEYNECNKCLDKRDDGMNQERKCPNCGEKSQIDCLLCWKCELLETD